MTYTYTRTQEYSDIPAAPGWRVRISQPYAPSNTYTWQTVIAWRISQSASTERLGEPIIVGPYGLKTLQLERHRAQRYEFLPPGEEVPE